MVALRLLRCPVVGHSPSAVVLAVGKCGRKKEHGIGTETSAEAEAVNENRYREAAATGASTVAVGCPFCLTMMTDAATSASEGVVVKDIVELIAESL